MGCTSSKVVLINPNAMPEKRLEDYSDNQTSYGFNPTYVHYYTIPSNNPNNVHKNEKKIEGRRHYEQIYLAERGFSENNEKQGISDAQLLCYDPMKLDIHGQTQKSQGPNQAAHKKIDPHTARYSISNPHLKKVHGFDSPSFSDELVRPSWRLQDLANHEEMEQGFVNVILNDRRNSRRLKDVWRRQELVKHDENEQGSVTVILDDQRCYRSSSVDSAIRSLDSSLYGSKGVDSSSSFDELVNPAWTRQNLANHEETEQGLVTVLLDDQRHSVSSCFTNVDSSNRSSDVTSSPESKADVLSTLASPKETTQTEMCPVLNELDKFEYRCPPRGENRVVVYITSLKAVRKTYEDCHSMKLMLQSLRIQFYERDVSMHSRFKEELASLTDNNNLQVPKLFIRGRYIGGIETVKQLQEDGRLRRLVKGIPDSDSSGKICEGCGNMRFVPCLTCNGSCKVLNKLDTVIKCSECDENGLILCLMCI